MDVEDAVVPDAAVVNEPAGGKTCTIYSYCNTASVTDTWDPLEA